MPESARPLRTLSIGGATFDLFIKTDSSLLKDVEGGKAFSLPLGSKLTVNDVIGACGGGASNTSVGLSRLGCTASFSGVIGDDQWGELIRINLEKAGVNLEHATIVEHEASSFAIILSADNGERTILAHKGMDRHFDDVTFDRDAVLQSDAVYLNRIHDDACEISNDIIERLAHRPNTHLTWNPGGCQIESGLRLEENRHLVSHTNLLLLNKEEALTFSGTKTTLEALHLLVNAGAGIVCITDGKNGAIATDGKTLYKCPSVDCPVVDTTGAGDGFGTAMTWAILRGKDLPQALKAGTINAMSVVSVTGAQAGLLTETQIEQKLVTMDIAVTQESF